MKKTKKILAVIMAAVMMFSISAPGASALAVGIENLINGNQPVILIVELEEGSATEQRTAFRNGTRKEAVKTVSEMVRNQNDTASVIKDSIDSDISTVYHYTEVFNGFSINAKQGDIRKIRELDGVKNVYISRKREKPDPVAQNSLNAGSGPSDSFGTLTQAYQMHREGIKGEGMLIAVVDTEFDTSSEFLTTVPSDSSKLHYKTKEQVKATASAVSVNAGSDLWYNEKIPVVWNYEFSDNDTSTDFEELVHGSHVAGIAAGKNGRYPDGSTFYGVAPEAQLLCLASTNLYDYANMAAIDDAVKFGADAINLSWGTDYSEVGVYDTVFANAADAGVMIFSAAGNSGRGIGPNPLTAGNIDYSSMGVPGIEPEVISVASANNSSYWESYYYASVDGRQIKIYNYNKEIPFYELGTKEYVYCGENNEEMIPLEGKIAVFEKGDLTFASRAQDIARAQGAAGVLFIVSEMIEGIKPESMAGIAVACTYEENAEILRNASNKTLTTDPTEKYSVVSRDLEISSYSSWGVYSDLVLNPDITAPGANIYSSVPKFYDETGYTVFSGTSMASPHLTGGSVLIKQSLLQNSPSFSSKNARERINEVNSRAMSSAAPIINPENGIEYSPRVQGSGLLQIKNAVETPVILEGDEGFAKLSLREIGENFEIVFKAENLSDTDVTYDNISVSLFTDGHTEKDGVQIIDGTQRLSAEMTVPQSVTVPAKKTVSVSIPVTLDSAQVREIKSVFTSGFFADGYVYLGCSGSENPDISLAFTGFCGDWEGRPKLDTTNSMGYNKLFTAIANGTPIYSVDDSGVISVACGILGENFVTNPLVTDESVLDGFNPDATYNDISFSAISPNGDGAGDFLGIQTSALSLCEAKMTVLDKNGNRVEFKNSGNLEWAECLQTYKNYDYDTPVDLIRYKPMNFMLFGCTKGLLVNNYFAPTFPGEGEYKVRVQSGNEVFELPFAVDNTKPEIRKCEVSEENGRTYMHVSVSDNRNVMYICVYETGIQEVYKIHPVEGLGNAEYVFDVTDAGNINKLAVEVSDYALNVTQYSPFGEICRYCGQIHTGFLGMIIAFIHKIIFAIFG